MRRARSTKQAQPSPGAPAESASDAAVIESSLATPIVFATLFDRHAGVIHRYLARRTGSVAVDDLLAETFAAAFATRGRYDLGRHDARPWLYGIASNMLARHHHAEQQALRLVEALGSERAASSHEDRVVGQVVAKAIRRELGIALASLSVGDRDVLLLVAWEELTYEEVAQALTIPVGTVRSRLHRARLQLRPLLEQLDGRDILEEVLRNE